MIQTQFTLYLPNRPGVLALVTRKLAAAKVNIEGVSAATSADIGLVQIVVDNAAAAARVLKQSKISVTTQKVAVLPMRNRPGELARITSKLAAGGVNINYVYGTTCRGDSGCECGMVVSAPDLKKVERIWAQIR